MHGDTVVADLNLGIRGDLLGVAHVASPDHMPYGTLVDGSPDILRMDDWWVRRAIPRNRRRSRDVLEGLGMSNPIQLVLGSSGISLTDRYWIRPRGTDIPWKDVDPSENTFPMDLGDILFGLRDASEDMDLRSPDSTCDGMLRKRWCIIDGMRCLMKGGNRPFPQEPYNEVIASRIADLLHIPHVDYSLMSVKGRPCSVCDDMADTDTELIPAYRASYAIGMWDDESSYNHYVRACDSMGLDIVPSLDRMIVLDHLIMNTDRHTNNFGIIRDADTLEWIGAAPVFDSGSSLCHDDLTENIHSDDRVGCKPFRRTFGEQIDLVSSFDWVDEDALDRIPRIAREVLSPENGWNLPDRTDAVVRLLEDRVGSLRCRIGC